MEDGRLPGDGVTHGDTIGYTDVGKLWQEHRAAPFPSSLRGRGVSGVDFVMLDADIAGCLSVFLDRGTLDVARTATLGLCCRDCERVLAVISREEGDYFRRLAALAELVLKVLRKSESISERINPT